MKGLMITRTSAFHQQSILRWPQQNVLHRPLGWAILWVYLHNSIVPSVKTRQDEHYSLLQMLEHSLVKLVDDDDADPTMTPSRNKVLYCRGQQACSRYSTV